MPEWLSIPLVVIVVGGAFGLLYLVLKKLQAGDPGKRGQDSTAPPDSY